MTETTEIEIETGIEIETDVVEVVIVIVETPEENDQGRLDKEEIGLDHLQDHRAVVTIEIMIEDLLRIEVVPRQKKVSAIVFKNNQKIKRLR